jgi:hypothetical protein
MRGTTSRTLSISDTPLGESTQFSQIPRLSAGGGVYELSATTDFSSMGYDARARSGIQFVVASNPDRNSGNSLIVRRPRGMRVCTGPGGQPKDA